MKIEYSALFGIRHLDEPRLDVHIGDGVQVQEILSNGIMNGMRDELRAKNPEALNKLEVREDHEHWGVQYSHRFFVSLEAERRDDSIFREAEERIVRAIVLLRLVKPTPIASRPTVILKEDDAMDVFTSFGFYSTAYIRPPDYRETLRTQDLEQVASLWPAFENIFKHRDDFKMMHRALHTFNDAYHIDPNHISHIVLHAALEALICAGSRNNKKQVVVRLQQICGIAEQDAEDIYHYCCGVKHAAEPALPNSVSDRDIHPDDQRRITAGTRLDTSLRFILRKALEDDLFAKLLEDKALLQTTYPV